MKINKPLLTLAIIYMCMIFYLSHQTAPEIISESFIPDYIFHYVEFLILAILLYFAFDKNVWLAFSITALWGIIDEIHQYFIPTRFFSIIDILADTVAGLSIFLISRIYRKIYK